MTWPFAAILFLALAMTAFTSWIQMHRYTAAINQMARDHKGAGCHLVTGRKNGKLNGAVVALVVDVPRRRVVAASTMTGRTAFAKLQPAPELVTSIRELPARASSPAVAEAIQDALNRLPKNSR